MHEENPGNETGQQALEQPVLPETPFAKAGLLRGDNPREPSTVAYKPPSGPPEMHELTREDDVKRTPLVREVGDSPGPEPGPFKMEEVDWTEPGEVLQKNSVEPPMFPDTEHYPVIKYFNQAGELETGWRRARVSDAGQVVITRMTPEKGTEIKFLDPAQYAEMQSREFEPAAGKSKPSEKESATEKLALEQTPSEATLAKAEAAAADGDTAKFVNYMTQLVELLNARANQGGVDPEALTLIKDQVSGEDVRKRAEQAARDMCQIENIEELRDKIARQKENSETIISKYLRLNSPLEAPPDVQQFVRGMAGLSKSRFENIKKQLSSKEELPQEDEKLSGELDLSAEYQVEVSNGLGEKQGGYKITAIYIENGLTYVDLEKPGPDKDNPDEGLLIRSHLPATTFLKWQQEVKPTDLAKKDKEDESTTVAQGIINPNDPDQMAASAARVDETLNELRAKRTEENQKLEKSKKLKAAFNFMQRRMSSLKEKGKQGRDRTARLIAAMAVAYSLDQFSDEALAAAINSK